MAKQKRGNGEGSVFKRGRYWWIAYYDERGERQARTSGFTERAPAERLLHAEADRVNRINRGLVDLALERLSDAAKRPITELVGAFGASIRAGGSTDRHAARTEREVREFAEAVGITALGEITAEHAAGYLETLRKAGQSARTRQCRITSVKGFTRWAWREGLLAADPLAGLKRPNPQTDRRHERRYLLVDEWRRLEAAAVGAGERFGMSGDERAMLYATAIQTGLRVSELESLTRGSLHLDDKQPFLVVKAGGTKNRKLARQFVTPALAERLKRHAARMAPGASVFALPPKWKMAEMLRADLAAARVAWIAEAKHDPQEAEKRGKSDLLTARNAEGLVLDFHALRHTCGAWAALGGASPKAIQTLMRHSTIVLTLDTYGHLLPDEAAETVTRLAGFDADQTEAATGTADCSNRVRNDSADECAAARVEASGRGESDSEGVVATIGPDTTCGGSVRADAGSYLNGPAGTRTRDRAIMSRVEGDQKRPPSAGNADLGGECSNRVCNPLPEIPSDARLAALIQAWPMLPEAVRVGILAMVRSTKTGEPSGG